MYTAAALLDLHERVHRNLSGLMEHCDGFSPEEAAREIEGFGYPSVRLQLHHVIGAEQYWIGVLQGKMLTEEHEEDHASMAALHAFRDRVAEVTRAYLTDATDEALNERRMMTTWGGKDVELMPAHVVLRTQTHVYQHKGQIAAMARLLGRPVPEGLDFPLR